MDYEFNITGTEEYYKGFYSVVKYELNHSLFKGGKSASLHREHISRGNMVAVLLYDPERDKVVLVEQFRVGGIKDARGAWFLEVVAGFIETGESPEEVARRETKEETDCEFSDLVTIGDYYLNAGNSSDLTTFYCARIDSRATGGVHGLNEEGEDIRVHVLSLDEALQILNEGRIKSATPIICMQWLALNRKNLRTKWS